MTRPLLRLGFCFCLGLGLSLGLAWGLAPPGGLVANGSLQPPLQGQGDRLEGALVRLLELERLSPAQALVYAQAHGIALSGSGTGAVRVRVVVEAEPGRAGRVRARLERLGAVVNAQHEGLLSAAVPLEALRAAAQLPGVQLVRRPLLMRPLQLKRERDIPRYETGVLPTGALLLHGLGIKGRGVRVAIIDVGFEGLREAFKRGWLDPSAVVATIDQSGEGMEAGGDHGLQVARIVHEMAPEAELILINLGEDGDEVALAEAVEVALRLGARVINHSIGWFDSNFGDGTGVVNEIARRAYEAGALWVNAAGNQAYGHWMGRLYDRDGDGWAEFGLGREALRVWATFGGVIQLVLVWDDFPRTDQDLDLFLLDREGKVVASATAPQRGLDPPREQLEYPVLEPGVYALKVRVKRVTRPLRFKLFSLEHALEPRTPHGSVVAPADCACALAVGAISAYRWEEGEVEGFSARGPTSDGRLKPDLVAPDGVRGFFGTSAAAPHVAGAAALIWSQHPDWPLERVRGALVEGALDVGAPGPDVESGHGKLQLWAGEPTASRTLSRGRVEPGGELLVRVAVRVPAMRFGALALEERWPEGFALEPVSAGDASLEQPEANAARWVWRALGPGEAREVVYKVRVSEGVAPGVHRVEGRLNGRPVAGDAELRVEAPPSASGRGRPRLILRVSEAGAGGRALLLRLEGGRLGDARVRLELQLFDLAGRVRLRFRTEGANDGRPWVRVPLGPQRAWANGVYLAVVTVRDADGGLRLRRVVKLVLLR